jgi:hypothetical protein
MAMATGVSQRIRGTAGGTRNRVIGSRGPAYWLSAALGQIVTADRDLRP